jgi:hypothetical protein
VVAAYSWCNSLSIDLLRIDFANHFKTGALPLTHIILQKAHCHQMSPDASGQLHFNRCHTITLRRGKKLMDANWPESISGHSSRNPAQYPYFTWEAIANNWRDNLLGRTWWTGRWNLLTVSLIEGFTPPWAPAEDHIVCSLEEQIYGEGMMSSLSERIICTRAKCSWIGHFLLITSQRTKAVRLYGSTPIEILACCALLLSIFHEEVSRTDSLVNLCLDLCINMWP